MRYAIIDNGVVSNIILLDDPSLYPIPATAVTDDIVIGATYSNGIFTNPQVVTNTNPTVPKSIVMARVIAANKMADAQTALWANPNQFAQWFAPDKPDIECTDPATVAFVKALGLDPNVILAP